MVNIKYFGLPLLVGLFYFGKVLGANPCTIVAGVGNGCSETDYGYQVNFAVNTDTEGTLFNLIAGGAGAVTQYKGFYKAGTTGSRYISCYDKSGAVKCKYIEKSNITSYCSDSTIGQLVLSTGNSVGLCLAKYKVGENISYPVLSFADKDITDDNIYLVQHTLKANNGVFSFDITANYYTVKRDDSSIYLYSPASNIEYEGILTDSGKKVSRKEDFCNAKSSGLYINCETSKGGACKSYKQSSQDVQELNGETCKISKDGENYTATGNCVAGNYLINSSGILITDTSTNTILISITNSLGNFEVSKPTVIEGYYLNADSNTKQENPLIYCDSNKKCALTPVQDIGYYITLDTGSASVIACESKSKCESYLNTGCVHTGTISNSSGTVKLCNHGSDDGIEISGVLENNKSENYYLLSVEEGKFPSIKSTKNIAVKVNREKTAKTATVTLIDIVKSECSVDNEIIQISENSAFYYCAGGIPVKMKANNKAKFAIKDDKYKIITLDEYKISASKKTGDNYDATYEGYYINRSNGANGLVKCEKEIVNNPNPVEKLKCEEVTDVFNNDYEVYINKEENFPYSANDQNLHDAKIIVCSRKSVTPNCFLPTKDSNTNKYTVDGKVLGRYFTNSNKELIICDGGNGNGSCTKTDSRDTSEQHIKVGIYLDGVKDLSLIKCEELKDDSTDVNKVTGYPCKIIDANKYSYYTTKPTDGELIYCNNSECNEESSKTGSFLNGNTESNNKIIDCILNGGTRGCSEVEAKDYYVDNSKTEGMNLLKCSENTCTRVDGKDRGVYISNGGSRLVSCSTSTGCKVIENSKSTVDTATEEGKLHYLNGDDNGNTLISIVSVPKKENPNTRKKRAAGDYYWSTKEPKQYDIYLNSNVEAVDDEDHNRHYFIYCNNNSSNTVVCTEILASSTDSTDKFIDIHNLKIYSKSGSEYTSTDINNNLNILVNKNNGKEISTSETSISGSLVECKITPMKICEYKTSDLKKFYKSNNNIIINENGSFSIKPITEMTQGYYINSESEIIKCDGTNCVIIELENECNSSNIGSILKEGLCVGVTAGVSKVSMISQTYVINSSSFPGKTGFIKVIIESNKILLDKSDTINQYYLVDPVEFTIANSVSGNNIYRCKDGECSDIQNSSDGKVYQNANTANSGTYPFIKCNKESTTVSCIYYNLSETNYYCLDNKTSKLNSCIVNPSSGSSSPCDGTCFELTGKDGYYLPYKKDTLISCTSSTCKNESETNLKVGYYLSQDPSNALIKCDKSTGGIRCDYEVNASDGYYIAALNNQLIQCKNGVCISKNIAMGWYLSGEPGKVIINCDNTSCNSFTKTAVGWYPNISPLEKEKLLIYCQTNKTGDKITCNEMKPINNGNYIMATDDSGSNIITCQTTCSSTLAKKNIYYVSGENNKQLIYCTSKGCNVINGKPNYWYLPQNISEIIGCTSNGCESYEISKLMKGYYINGDEYSSKPLIEIKDSTRNIVSDIKNGWYINAGSKDSENKIIECCNDNPICELKAALKADTCSSSNNGKFIVDSSGVVSWCINQVKENLLDETDITEREVFGTITGTGLFNWIVETSGSLKFSIGKNSILQDIVDGFYFNKSENKLYKCVGWGSGVCTLIENVIPGFYINYNYNGEDKAQLIRCRDDDTILCRVYEYTQEADQVSCGSSNFNVILKDKNTAAICKDDINDSTISLKDLTIDYIFSISNKGFPDVLRSKRYLLVNVNKYSVTKREIIEEISNCDDVVVDKNIPDLVCLKSGTIRKANAKDTILTGTIKVNKSNVKAEPKYDYDTNSGYFYYDGGKLKTVFIKQIENKKEFKFECEIGGVCVRRKMGVEPILGYQFENGILKIQKMKDNNANVVTEKIMPGTYVQYVNGSKNSSKAIKCKSEGEKVNCSEVTFANSDVSFSGGYITYRIGNIPIQGSSFHTKFVRSQNSFSKRNSSSIKYKLNALTDVSFSEKAFEEVTNIFLLDYMQISNEYVTSSNYGNIVGYSCETNGDCQVIDNSGNNKYYINTIQKNEKENAVAVCGNNKCEFINAQEGLMFENAAAVQGKSDALIKCTNNNCFTTSLSNVNLPECKYDGNNQPIKDKSNNNSCMISADESLLNGQHCILNGVIYKFDGNECKGITETSTLLFDATYRKLDPTKIAENHFGASIYSCPTNSNCYITYGYIINGSTYSICSKGIGCIYFDDASTTLKSSCSEAGEGALIYKNSSIKLCYNNNNDKVINYNYLTINIENNFPDTSIGDSILVSFYNNIYSLVIEDGYLLIENTGKIISNTSSNNGILYECNKNTKNCQVNSTPKNGYYYSSAFKNVIECNSTICKMNGKTVSNYKISEDETIEFSNNDSVRKYFPSSKFIGYSFSVIAEASKYKINVFKANNYILLNNEHFLANGSETSDLDNLYYCQATEGRCSSIDKKEILDGWYLSDQAEAIKCVNGYCAIVSLHKSCSGEGDLIIKEGIQQICLTLKNQKTYSAIKLKDNIGLLSELTNKNIAFPNGKTYVVVNANSVLGLGYTDKENNETPRGLTQCGTVTATKCTNINGKELSEGQYCIKDSKIYKVEKVEKENKCNQQFVNSDITVEIFTDSSMAQSTSSSAPAYIIGYSRQMFVCKKGICAVTTGYKKYNNKVVVCDYAQCKERSPKSTPTNGEMNSSNQLKVDVGLKSFTGNDDKYYYYMSGSNNFPGIETQNKIIVQVGKDYMIPYKAENTGYYLISETGIMYSKDPLETEYTESLPESHVYYCHGGDFSCIKKDTENENVYYVNAAASQPNLALIGCYNSKCRIAKKDDILNEETTSVCDSVGKIVRKAKEGNNISTFGDYSLCAVKGKNPISIKRSNVKSKYIVITLERKNKFAGIEIPDEDNYNNVSRNIIIENSDLYLRQYENEGYILYSSTTSEIIETVNVDKGNLYKCSYTSNYNGAAATLKSYECKAQTNINNGWYFNEIYGDKRLIRCIEGKCVIIEAKELTKCINSGSLIYNNNEFKICQTLNKQIDIKNNDMKFIMNVSLLNDFPGLKTNSTEILVKIKDNAAYQVKLQTNIVVRDDNIVIENNEERGNLYQCVADGKCSVNMIPNDGYYIKKSDDGDDSELIYCDKRKCKLISNEDNNGIYKNVYEGFRISANSKMPLIQCIKPGYAYEDSFKQTGVTVCKEKEYRAGWFILAGNNDSSLIECNQETGCNETPITKDDDGWYINAASNSLYSISKVSNSTVYPIIECNGGICSERKEKIESECKKGGDLISPSTGTYKICKSESKSIDFSKVSVETYDVINNEGGFPTGTNGYIVLRITGNRVSIAPDGNYYKENAMYECNGSCNIIKDDSRDGNYVYDKISKNLMYASCSNGECSWSPNKIEGNIFLDVSGNLVTSTSTSNIESIYECIRNSSKNIVCGNKLNSNTKGYFFNAEIKGENGAQNTVLYKCLGTTCEDIKVENIPKCTNLSYNQNICYISYNNEPYNEEVSYINPGQMCMTEDGKYYFAIKQINTGIDDVNCVAIPSDASVNYYRLSNGLIYEINKYNTKYISSSNVVNGLDNSIFFSKTTETGIWKEINGNAVSCNKGKCESLTKIPECTYDFQTGKCKISSGSLNAGQFCVSALNPDNYYLTAEKISSSPGSCIRHKTVWGYSLGSSNVEPDYSNASNPDEEKSSSTYHIIDNKMFIITANDEVYIKSEGVFIIDDANKKVSIKFGKSVDIGKDSQFKLYVCTSTGCKHKVTCATGTNNEYIFDDGNILKCDPKTNTLSYANSGKYFLNGPWEDLIDCSEGECVEKNNENGMEGYYLDSGNEAKIIKCIRENEKFICVNEDAIECEYEWNEGICKSKNNVDLLRNSYCYHIQKDSKTGRITDAAKLLYVEKYIKAGDTGTCENVNETDVLFYHYRKSKFLGKKEVNEVLKYTKGAIVSLFEKDLGYYIINTENGKGITVNTDLNKSRIYECTINGCIEILEPVNGRIYINKASSEKMVRYDESSKKWIILNNKCTRNVINPNQCILSSNGLNEGDIIYIYEKGQLKFKASKNKVATKYTVIDDNNYNVDVKPEVYQYFNGDSGFNYNGDMYVLNKSLQYFELVTEKGMYFFKYSNNYYNLEPYRSTVNNTNINDIMIYTRNDDWRRSFNMNKNEGYYLNKADINEEGLVIEVMEVPEKRKEEEESNKKKREIENDEEIEDNSNITKRNELETTHKTFKSVINKCTSVKKNVCLNKRDNQIILPGSVCVVTEGDLSGLYLATANIIKTSTNPNNPNCLHYDGEYTYQYIGDNGMFADEEHEKTLIQVDRDNIIAFDKSKVGYYILDSEKKKLKSTTSITASAYNCTIEYQYTTPEKEEEEPELIEGTDHLECVSISNPNKYILSELSSVVIGKNGKWNQESKKGYYFFNESKLPATTYLNKDTKVVTADNNVPYFVSISNTDNDGTYINNAVTDNVQCSFTAKDSTCKSKNEDELNTQDACYDSTTKKLYLVEVIDQEDSTKKTMCYTGSDKLKYRFVNNVLYRLDGISVQELKNGYYVLNEKWEEFSSTYPEIPFKIIKCDDRCDEVNSIGIDIDADVLINQAGTGVNKLLKYYVNSGKFLNISKPGYYFFNNNNGISKDSGYNDYENNSYELSENGILSEVVYGSFNLENIYINYAKEGSLTRSLSEFDGTNYNIKYNAITDIIEYNNKSYENENENVIIRIENLLYVYKGKYLELLSEGLYALSGNEPFTNNKWTSLSSGSEICYYVNGSCNSSTLSQFKKQQYAVNSATKKPTLIEYNSERDQWRMVDNDGVYFFFEDGYNINKANRRISHVYEVIEGEVIDITENENRLGYYKFNGLIVESNEDGWEDAKPILKTVDVKNKRKCMAYEIDEVINNSKLCYNTIMESICIPKGEISAKTIDVNNCVFGEAGEIYYFLVENKLFSISQYAYKHIRKSGIYIISTVNKMYKEKLENKAKVYDCNNGECKEINTLKSGYYLNMANSSNEYPVILYYNSDVMTWRKTSIDGIYFFNKNGYAISDEEEVKYAYIVKDNGNSIVNILEGYYNGTYISDSNNISESIIVENNEGKWNKAKKVPNCKIDEEGKVTSLSILKTGNICIDNRKIVIISKSSNDDIIEEKVNQEGIKERRKEYSYEGVTADYNEVKYSFQANDNSIVKLEKGKFEKLSISGYVVIDKTKNEPLESVEPIDNVKIYKCFVGNCTEVDNGNITKNSLYINSISEKKPLVIYIGESKWSVLTEKGFYFFDNNGKIVNENSIVSKAFEILEGGEQNEISESTIIGYYFNKATSNKIIVGNEKQFWSKGNNVRKCNITEVVEEHGMNCRSMDKNEVLENGDYCYSEESGLYILIGESSQDSEGVNCISGSNEEPKYISSETVNILNGVDVGTKLIELTDDSIKVVKPGIYIINENGTIIEENNNGKIETKVYNCNESDCNVEEMEASVMFLIESGEIFVTEEEGALKKVNEKGLYFFKSDGKACDNEDDVLGRIVKIKENEIIELGLYDLEQGFYINNANNKTVGVYKDGTWDIVKSQCKYIEETKSCTSDDELVVGSYCVVDGIMYFIKEIKETDDGENMICISGNDSKPLYFANKDGELLVIKEKSISIIEEEGYYAYNDSTFEALQTDKPISSRFIKCNEEGNCVNANPEKSSNYLNKAIENRNIVSYAKGDVEEAVTNESQCTINGNVCSIKESELSVGDLCVADNSLYIIKNKSECVKAEKYVISYQLIGNNLYMVGVDAVVQKYDGYYFIDGNNRAIIDKNDYANPDTVGYMCSVSGECFEIDPDIVKYYKDYTTEINGHFTVVKYDPEKKMKRTEKGGSGYEVLSDEGIYKLDDGSYVNCEMGNNGDVLCKEMDKEGSMMTNDGELLTCSKNDRKEIECSQATKGGYYMINNKLMECESNDDGDKLECSIVQKEGYFFADNHSVLYNCVEIISEDKNVGISAINNSLLNVNTEVIETMEKSEKSIDNGETEKVEYVMKRDEETSEEKKKEQETRTETETSIPSSTTTIEIPTPTPVDVTCKVEECIAERVINNGSNENNVDLYICKKIEKSENDENNKIENENNKQEIIEEEEEKLQWVAKSCDSGNFLKEGDNYYKCEDEKEGLDESKILKPNEDHTSTEKTGSSKTKTTVEEKPNTTTSIEEKPTTSKTKTITTIQITTTTKAITTTTKAITATTKSITNATTTKAATTTTNSTSTTNESGANPLKSVPSMIFYIILFVFVVYLQY